MHTTRSPLSPRLFTALLAGCVATAALAQPLPPSQFAVEGMGSFGHFDRSFGAVPRTLDLDWTGVWGSEPYNMQVQAEAFGGLRPQATASAEAHGSGSLSFYCVASARIEYYTRVRAVNTPPPGQYSVPIRIGVRGHASGNATSQVMINGSVSYTVNAANGNNPEFDVSVPWELWPGSPGADLVQINLVAYARGSEWPANPALYPHSSLAVADPLFELDQVQFNLMMGGASFPLADYFDFEYSEGVFPMPCDPDFTCDGNADQNDVACLIDEVAGNPGCGCRDADFNADGNVDQDDVAALINVVAGGACP